MMNFSTCKMISEENPGALVNFKDLKDVIIGQKNIKKAYNPQYIYEWNYCCLSDCPKSTLSVT